MPFTIVRQDITKMDVDAIVNAANTELLAGGGVCGAIFAAAGESELQAACDQLAPIRTGEAVVTPGFRLPARFVIHTAGPVYNPSRPELSERQLRSCYLNSLDQAAANGCASIAFPLISSGIYGYPKRAALTVATSAIVDWLKDGDMDVYLAVFGKEAFDAGEQLLGDVESYIDEHYVQEHRDLRRSLQHMQHLPAGALNMPAPVREGREYVSGPASGAAEQLQAAEPVMVQSACLSAAPLDELVGNLDEPFSDTLLRLIDAKGATDVEVYKRANIDRKLFSKIRGGKGYTPSKRTALALAVALRLSIEETGDLLRRAGYALSHSQVADVIIEYFIVNGRYDIFQINEVLFQYDQPLLGS